MIGTATEWHEVKFFSQKRNLLQCFIGLWRNSPSDSLSRPSRVISTFDYGRLGYSYKDKYFLNATLRYDGSSRLAEGYEWDYFPAVGTSWRFR